MRPLPDEYDW